MPSLLLFCSLHLLQDIGEHIPLILEPLQLSGIESRLVRIKCADLITE